MSVLPTAPAATQVDAGGAGGEPASPRPRPGLAGAARAGMAALAAVPLGGCAWRPGFFDAAGPVAAAQADHFRFVTLVMLAVCAPLFLALPVVLWTWRRGGRGPWRPDWSGSRAVEAVVWGVPAVVLVVLGTQLWRRTMEFDPQAPLGPAPLEVRAVMLDRHSLFLYPAQGVASLDRLVLPRGRPVTLELTSSGVMRSLAIPRLAGQVYAMGGMATRLNLRADQVGTFEGRNMQYDGPGFPREGFAVAVEPPERFEAWLAQTRAQAPTMSPEAYAALSAPPAAEAPRVFSAYPAGLFDQVLAATRGEAPPPGGEGAR
ncbi:COX aromatic rich motif-containing protein [Albimonas sp. CAU 1670]|uniref:COX aromatic rich motif-containing protein n=1 Tax=Albimonas sp. CAU 1670 TaxID=3032599 RepID=UPI0023DB9567|nr:COX aromatic rich motif-containing protein [Albimonas sp. CAU 1670]MDF2235315.1 COX aromatic rich motif-containing protein [Albimonas sp. CAU 1670]